MGKHDLRAILIGLGDVGAGMIPFLQALDGFAAIGLADPNPSALDRAGGLCAQDEPWCEQSWERALERAKQGTPDQRATVAIINTPGDLHVAPVRAALQAGLHVLVAKPFAPTLTEARELVTLAGEMGRTLCVAQQMRWQAHMRALRHAVESGRIGRVEVVHWLNSKPRPNPANLRNDPQPAIREMSCHHFDTLLYLLGQPKPSRICMDGFQPSWSPYAGPCMLHGMLEFEENLHVLYHAGFSAQAPCYDIRLEGTEGALRCRGTHMSVDDALFELARPRGRWTPVALPVPDPDRSAWSILLDQWQAHVRGAPEPSFSGRSNLLVMAMIEAAIESMAQGAWVEIDDCQPNSI